MQAPQLQVTGQIARYGPRPAHLLQLSGSHERQVVLVGGLTAGLLAVPFVPQLAQKLEGLGWGLAQAQLQSCFNVRFYSFALCRHV